MCFRFVLYTSAPPQVAQSPKTTTVNNLFTANNNNHNNLISCILAVVLRRNPIFCCKLYLVELEAAAHSCH